MSADDDFVHVTVERFLIEQRNNLIEDHQSLTTLLKKILQERQVPQVQNISKSEEKVCCNDGEAVLNNSDEIKTSFGSNVASNVPYCESQSTKLPTGWNRGKLREYNSQTEKERLAKLFENAPCVLNLTDEKKRELGSSYRHRKNSKYLLNSENKENVPLDPVDSNTENTENTSVRCGEFSPLNLAFRTNKKFLELGEYEQLRKIFLEKKKREYVQYFDNNKVKEKTESNPRENNSTLLKTKDNLWQQAESFSEILLFSPSKLNIASCADKKTMSEFKKCQQEAYRHELDKQIEEKKRAQQAEKDRERKTSEIWTLQEMIRRENLINDIENKFCKRIHNNNVKDEEQTIEISTRNKDNTNFCSTSNLDEKYTKLSSGSCVSVARRFQSPILKPSVEACAVDDYKAYQKMQKELYKKSLAEQIMEKKKIERDRKLKEIEIELKIEENVRKEEEKLRQQCEKEEAERNYRATQKAQIEKQLQENLCRIQKQNEERKKVKKVVASKACNIYSTNHQIGEKSKNVTFATQAFMHHIPNEHSLEEKYGCLGLTEEKKACQTGSMIVQAPYVLAVKNSPADNSCCEPGLLDKPRSPSPVLPAVRTRNLINALPKSDHVEIPVGVSMSEQTKNQFERDEKILSNLCEIRRKLLENQFKVGCRKK